MTTLYLAKNDYRWVIFISLKTINIRGFWLEDLYGVQFRTCVNFLSPHRRALRMHVLSWSLIVHASAFTVVRNHQAVQQAAQPLADENEGDDGAWYLCEN